MFYQGQNQSSGRSSFLLRDAIDPDDDDDDDDDDINLRPWNLSSNLPKGIGTC